MRKILLSVVLILPLTTVAQSEGWTPTVSAEKILRSRMERLNSLSYEEVAHVFKNLPSTSLTCIRTETFFGRNEDAEALFHDLIPENPQLALAFQVQAAGDGFDVKVVRDQIDAKTGDEASRTGNLGCTPDADFKCSSLTWEYARQVLKPREDYAPEVDIVERFEFLPTTTEAFFAHYKLSVTNYGLDMWGRKQMGESTTVEYLCRNERALLVNIPLRDENGESSGTEAEEQAPPASENAEPANVPSQP